MSNYGAITVTATSETATANGLSGDANASAYTYGVYSYYGSITNYGLLSVVSHSGDARSDVSNATSNADTFGLYSEYGKVQNFADIKAEAISESSSSYGVSSASAKAGATIYGIFVDSADVHNTGDITLSARAGTINFGGSEALANIESYGIHSGEGDITNFGSIFLITTPGTASSTGAKAQTNVDTYGISLSKGTAENFGAIQIQATAGTSTSPVSANVRANANSFGIHASNGEIKNSGDILISAIGGTATSVGGTAQASASAFGLHSLRADITNSGKISVTANAGTANGSTDTAYAYGIYISEFQPSPTPSTIHSSGLISVEANGDTINSEAYQVFSETDLTITGFAIAFGDDKDLSTYDNAIALEDPSSLSISFEAAADATPGVSSAKLYAYTTNDTLEGEAYDLTDLMEGQTLSANSFGELETWSAPGLTSTDWQASFVEGSDNTQVIFNYDPAASVSHKSAQIQSKILRSSVELLKTVLLDHHETAQSEAELLSYAPPSQVQQDVAQMPDITAGVTRETMGEIFFSPYYASQNGDADPMGYDAYSVGLVAGYNRHLTANLTVGVSGFYASSDIDYTGTGYEDRSEDVDTYAGGLQFAWSKDNFRLSGLSTYAYSKNDYRDSAPTNLETADYNGRSVLSSLNLQYMAKFGANTFVPELGLSHQWVNREAYTTDNTVAADTTYGALNDNRVDVSAKLSWYGELQMDELTLTPHLGAGIRQALTDGKLESSMSSGANGYAVLETDEDRTIFTTSASLGVQGEALSASLGYVGEYSANTSDSSLYGRIAYRF